MINVPGNTFDVEFLQDSVMEKLEDAGLLREAVETGAASGELELKFLIRYSLQVDVIGKD